MKKTARRNIRQIFAAPLAVAIVSTVGLVAALVGDGWWDVSSWAALAVPVLLYLFFLWWPHAQGKKGFARRNDESGG